MDIPIRVSTDNSIYYLPDADALVTLELDKNQWLEKLKYEDQLDWWSNIKICHSDILKNSHRHSRYYDPRYSKAAEILLTDACNLKCKYCYSAGYRSNQVLNIDIIRTIIRQLFLNAYLSKQFSGKKDNIHIFFHGGGEPTTAWDELSASVEYAEELSSHYNIGVRFRIATNGVFIEDKLRYMINHNFDFRVSLDGIGEVNDLTRIGKNNESIFNIVSKNLDIMNEIKSRFIIAGVVTNENIDYMKDFTAYVIQRWKNINDIRFLALEETENTEINKLELLDKITFCNLKNECIKNMLMSKVGIYKGFKSFEEYCIKNYNEGCSTFFMKMPVYNCNGDILRCNGYISHTDTKIGWVENTKFYYIPHINEKIYGNENAYIETCRDCIVKNYCEYSKKSCVILNKTSVEYCTYLKNFYKDTFIKVAFEDEKYLGEIKRYSSPDEGIRKIIVWSDNY